MSLDAAILLWIQENLRCDFLSAILIPYTHGGDVGILWLGLFVILMIFRNNRKAALLALTAFGLSFLLCDCSLKLIINRTRPFDAIPNLMALVERPSGSSCPSGHTSTAFGFTLGFFFNSKNNKVRIPLLVAAVVMAFSRLYVGVHYPTDVLAGMAVGTVAALIATFGFKLLCSLIQKIKNKKTA